VTVHRADALDLLDYVEPGTAQAAVTSPPYLAQRHYGDDPREGGREATVDDYAAWLAQVLEQVRTALAPDGLLWLNLGDKANGSGGAGGDWAGGRTGGPARFADPAYELASFLDVPGAVLRTLLARGWRLRAPIVWDKGREAPEDLRHVRRPRPSHEVVYLLAPSATRSRFYPSTLPETGTVWHFPAGGNGDPHLAPFPDELPRRAILASTLPGDLVVDPFSGSGTTVRVAEALGRHGTGTDLYAPVEEGGAA
jgi:site-specific DNA-methyltransferase (cytosine-N4-specific)